jgi:uncharacterized protein YjcR
MNAEQYFTDAGCFILMKLITRFGAAEIRHWQREHDWSEAEVAQVTAQLAREKDALWDRRKAIQRDAFDDDW